MVKTAVENTQNLIKVRHADICYNDVKGATASCVCYTYLCIKMTEKRRYAL